jgi:hypothetical protein
MCFETNTLLLPSDIYRLNVAFIYSRWRSSVQCAADLSVLSRHVSKYHFILDRGKMLLGYSDAELANLGGYDLVHYDDLAYVASAHQECKWHY